MKEIGNHFSLIRKPVFAGRFYPSSKNLLKKQLDQFFARSKAPVSDLPLQAIIAPHAGYVFSGEVAASAYNQINNQVAYKRVFILASSHRCTFHGASVNNAHYYKTPLGRVKVDVPLTVKLHEMSPLFQYHEEAHLQEHSLEVQLPFLQHKLGNDFLLVPIVFGTYEPRECEEIAHMLEPWFTPENLFVVSTDFSHYPAYDDAVENDYNTAQAICSNNPAELLEAINKRKNIRNLATSLCGWTSVLTMLYLTQHKKITFEQVHYSNSGDAGNYGGKDKVVGYWAISVHSEKEKPEVSKHQQTEMLESARRAILLYLLTGRAISSLSYTCRGVNASGIFVSVYVKGKLRGCIGNLKCDSSSTETLEHLAVSASCDNRFDSITREDFDDMELEISLLSPLKKIKSTDEIVLGKHGIYIKKNSKSGTFLPKVATKTGWSVEEFLGHCARDKAGLNWDDWKDADVYVYEACVFRG